MKTVAIIQARMGSTRLPGKVLLPLGESTMLEQVAARVGRATLVDLVVVATTERPEDDAIAVRCANAGVAFFRGNEWDVLDRYYHTALEVSADTVVRITSDCPLIDPSVIDAVISRLAETGADYANNFYPVRTFPRGLDTEVMTFAALARAWRDDTDPSLREHVTPYLYRNPELFHLEGVTNDVDCSACRWTVDTPEDYELVRRIYSHYPNPGDWQSVLGLMKQHPDWRMVNDHIQQKTV